MNIKSPPKGVAGKDVSPGNVFDNPAANILPKVDLKNFGYPQTGAKTTGVKTRGNGAATKGTMARGPMG